MTKGGRMAVRAAAGAARGVGSAPSLRRGERGGGLGSGSPLVQVAGASSGAQARSPARGSGFIARNARRSRRFAVILQRPAPPPS